MEDGVHYLESLVDHLKNYALKNVNFLVEEGLQSEHSHSAREDRLEDLMLLLLSFPEEIEENGV